MARAYHEHFLEGDLVCLSILGREEDVPGCLVDHSHGTVMKVWGDYVDVQDPAYDKRTREKINGEYRPKDTTYHRSYVRKYRG